MMKLMIAFLDEKYIIKEVKIIKLKTSLIIQLIRLLKMIMLNNECFKEGIVKTFFLNDKENIFVIVKNITNFIDNL